MKTAETTRNQVFVTSHSPKILLEHHQRLAVVYVRQSSHHQVMENRESQARQYALKDHAQFLGWSEDRILVIDEDQGCSATSTDQRSGFQRLLSEVTMDHVGLVLALETSRLARSSRDWHQLFELCGVFGTLLADQEGIYNPNDPNDRLVLGLKGIMSEMEIQTMRNRLNQGKLNKARRGELFCGVPRGYVILPNGQVDRDPDEQVRSVVQMIFDKFEEIGSARSVLLWLTSHQIHLPRRLRSGAKKGEVDWSPPYFAAIYTMLHHPIYAGAYAYGRTKPAEPHRAVRKSTKVRSADDCTVLIQDCLPAYITWDQYQRNLERLTQNQSHPNTKGVARQGSSLLTGLVVCGHCGWRMQVGYHARDSWHYRCQRSLSLGIETPCYTFTGNRLDDLVSRQVLKALEPAAIELSLQAQTNLKQERERIDKHWQQKLKRARYDVDSAERRYRSVDSENRLVASTLEQQWEQVLRSERSLQDEYDRVLHQTRPELTPEEIAKIEALAADIPALWEAPQTSSADRQSIVRCLVEKVVVLAIPTSEYTDVVIHWKGGWESHLEFRRPIQSYEQLRDIESLKNRIRELWEAGYSGSKTAEILNQEGFLTIHPDQVFNQPMVQELRNRIGLRDSTNGSSQMSEGEWRIRALARHLNIRWEKLRSWARQGWVHSRQTRSQRAWILWADEEEIERLRQLHSASSRGWLGYPQHLTTPKPRPEAPQE